MGAEAVEGGASLFRQAYVGLGLDIRVHNLRAETLRRRLSGGENPGKRKNNLRLRKRHALVALVRQRN